ncbi:MAG: T9SS type A sorting domain-containing protein [Bacteroidetes bacterium]|nr:T9SS type A sorting domain-containing protein [Bacteroidota bacterium]
MKKIYTLITALIITMTGWSQVTVIGPANGGNFDAAGGLAGNNWAATKNLVAIPADDWVVSTAAGSVSGTQAAYVSTNPAAATPPYNYTFTSNDTLILARSTPVAFPVNNSCITLGFRWKCMGENDASNSDLDNMKVYMIPKAGPITSNDIQPLYQVGSVWYNGFNTWQTESFNLDPKLAGSGLNYTLAFVFVSDGVVGASTNPPAAVDNVLLTYQTPTAVPSCVVYTSPLNGATGLSPCNVTLTWNHSLGCNGATSYQVQTAPALGGPWTTVGTTNKSFYDLAGLAASTTYYWRIIPVNSFGANTAGCGFFIYNFTTGLNPVVSGVPPYNENFEGCINWTFYNGGLTNQWYIGNATSASGNRGLYISNNGGSSNTYTVTNASTVHAMSSTVIDLSGGGSCINLSFSYRVAGESGYDYLEVFAVPVGFTPTAGVLITGGSVGGALPNLSNPVKLAGPLNSQSTYTIYTASFNALAGYKFRLVFSWRNDNSVGTQPPAAVDDISITSSSGPSNDAPCNAFPVPPLSPAGLYLPGSNICGSYNDEPAPPACWTNSGGTAQVNTVWYRFIAPPSGCVRIRTERGSLYDTQIALYGRNPLTGNVACGAGNTLNYIACNDNRASCGGSTYLNSELTQSGLAPGYMYYISVDGKNGSVGTFTLFIMDGGAGCANPYPPTPGADCASPSIVCNNNTFVPNPGYQGYASVCDFTGGSGNCLLAGDRAGAWYQVNIIGSGNLMFDIVPNDYNGTSATDYDFAVWKMAGSGTLATCASIANPATQSQGEVRCNYSAQGVTGCYTGGNSPPAYPGFNSAYETPIPVTAGEVYYVYVNNWANSTSGFTLSFANTTPSPAAVINGSVPNGSAITWTGTVSSDWNDANNWGGCNIPSCSGVNGETDALITSSYVNPPIITGTVSCRNLTINTGASLTITGTGVLEICKDFNNNGSFNAQPGSLVLLDGPANAPNYNGTQNLDGNLTGANAFYHLDAYKANLSHVINANQDFDVKGNLKVGYNTGASLTNNTTTLNASPGGFGKYVKVGGDFLVFGNSAFTTGGGSVLEFNGAANQNYMNRASITSVYMNQSPASTVTVQPNSGVSTGAAYMTLNTTGTLTFNSGKLVLPGANPFLAAPNYRGYVDVLNLGSTGVITGMNPNSYIVGPGTTAFLYVLKKATTGAIGTYDLPVGTSTKYSNIQLDVKTALLPNPGYFLVGFDNTIPASNTAFTGGAIDECSVKYHSSGATALDNGLWRILTNTATSTSGVLDVTLTDNGYTNNSQGQTVMVNKTGNSGTAANWFLTPIPANSCISGTSLPGPVTRTNLLWSTMGRASANTPIMFGTAQAPNPLPVELLYLNATTRDRQIVVNWSTASEKNNKGFEVQRSTDGKEFEKIGWVDGNGTSNIMHTYSFVDTKVLPGIVYYYRLNQIDFDGKNDISKTVAASISDNMFNFTVSPNPFSGQANVTYYLEQTSDVSLMVINKLGQTVATLFNGKQEPGTYTYPFIAKNYGYSSGIYTVKIIINNQVYTRRLFQND